ncbi:MAG TPA: hypothetical protein VJ624_08270 [Thermodesulfobacteriota bacterium]|nr:hypothetical protein [Thermodesulfobacteriota bacterium]
MKEAYPDKATMEQKVNACIAKHILPKSAVALRIATKVARKRFTEQLKEDLKYYESVYLNESNHRHSRWFTLD